MNPQQIAVALTMERLGVPLKVDTPENRATLQSAIYLAQASGARLGYHFGWYGRPYCMALASDGESIVSERKFDPGALEGWKLDKEQADRIDQLIPLAHWVNLEYQSRWLDLLASTHFVVERGRVECFVHKVTSVLRSNGRDFSNKEVEEAIQQLRNHGLIATEVHV